jgi:hypothetical protein
LYGTRSAPRNFHKFLADQLAELGFQQLKSDASLFRDPLRDIEMSVHVDDPIVSGRDRASVEVFFEELEQRVLFKRGPALLANGPAVIYLGKSYTRDATSITVAPISDYIAKTLKAYGMAQCSVVHTPATKQNHEKDAPDQPLTTEDHKHFRSVLGRLMFLASERGDLQFALKELARSMSAPTTSDSLALKRVLRYLRGTETFGTRLSMPKTAPPSLNIFVDSDWAGCTRTRRSTSGFAVMFGGFNEQKTCLIASGAKTQPVIAQSSAEAELYALALGAAEGLFAQSVMGELGISLDLRIWCDSSSARAFVNRSGLGRMKHIELKWLWVQDALQRKRFSLHPIASAENVADLWTKALDRTSHEKHRNRANIVDITTLHMT